VPRRVFPLALVIASLWVVWLPATEASPERSENGPADRVEIYWELMAADTSLLQKYAEAARAQGNQVDAAGFTAAERQMKEQIAAKHHITMPQLEQIVHAMQAAPAKPSAAPIDWWALARLAGFLLANIPVGLLIGRIVFGGWDGFWDTCSASFWWSRADDSFDDYDDYRWAKLKLVVFLFWTLALLAAEYYVLAHFVFSSG